MRWLALPFWNFEERRLRALVRLILWATLPLMIGGMVVRTGRRLLAMPPTWLGPVPQVIEEQAIQARENNFEAMFGDASLWVIVALLVVAIVWASARWLDRRPLDDLGLRIDRKFWIDAVFGFALGGVLISSIAGAEMALGLASYVVAPEVGDVPHAVYAIVTLFPFLSIAIYEELMFRGYPLTNIAEGAHCRWIGPNAAVFFAMMITSLFFGVMHAGNPNASIVSTGNIMLAGVWLAMGYTTTGRLAIPLGIHFSWNLFQNLFGMPVSGQDRFALGSMLSRSVHGPEWVTGGGFGPEAGATGLVAMAFGTVLTLAWVRWRRGALRMDATIATFRP